MRIGVNTLFLIPDEVGGSQVYLRETLKALMRLADSPPLVLFSNRENDAWLRTVLASGGGRGDVVPLAVRASNRVARILHEQWALPRAANRAGVDVLWSPGYTMPLLGRFPQVVSVLDMQYKSHPDDLSFPARIITDVLVRMAVRRADRTIAISEFSKREILRHIRIAPSRVVVTPLGVDPVFKMQRSPPADVSRPYVLCVANTYPHKNVQVLVKAYASLQSRIPHGLVLVGKPRRGEASVLRALQSVPEPDRVLRFDRVPHETLIAFYQHAALFVLPSCYEGFGLPVAEAMMAGTPVLTTAGGAIPEVGGDTVTYADSCRSADLARRMLAMLAHPEPDQVRRARHRMQGFPWEQTARLTLACLRSVLPDGDRSPR